MYAGQARVSRKKNGRMGEWEMREASRGDEFWPQGGDGPSLGQMLAGARVRRPSLSLGPSLGQMLAGARVIGMPSCVAGLGRGVR
jgi:hypothetical protein